MYKILVIDDLKINRMIIIELLKRITNNSIIYEGENGLDLVEIVDNIKDIDLILTDIKMPKLSGIEAINQIKNKGYDIPSAAITAYIIDSIDENKFDLILDKPITITKLKQALNLIKNKHEKD